MSHDFFQRGRPDFLCDLQICVIMLTIDI